MSEQTASSAIEAMARELSGAPLGIVLAEAEAILAARNGTSSVIPLLPPFHVSDDDCYLVLPEDIASELIEMFRDGDVDLLAEAMRDGLVVIGVVEKEGRGKVNLHVEACAAPETLLPKMPFAHSARVGRGHDPIPQLNAIDEAYVTVSSKLVDEAGLEKMLKKPEQASASWRPPPRRKDLAGVDPTYAWSRQQRDGSVGIEAVLFSEYEELVMLLRPARLVPTAAPSLLELVP